MSQVRVSFVLAGLKFRVIVLVLLRTGVLVAHDEVPRVLEQVKSVLDKVPIPIENVFQEEVPKHTHTHTVLDNSEIGRLLSAILEGVFINMNRTLFACLLYCVVLCCVTMRG